MVFTVLNLKFSASVCMLRKIAEHVKKSKND